MRPSRFAAAVLAVLFAAAMAFSGQRPPQRLVILHFNDFHGQVEGVKSKDGSLSGGVSRLAGLVERERRSAADAGIPSLLLFAGDMLTGTAFSSLFQGEPEFHVLRLLRADAAVPGNHEWDDGLGVFEKRALEVPFPFLAANVRREDGSPSFLRACTTVRAGRARIGIIGVTTPETPLTTAPGNTKGFAFSDPVEAVKAVLASPDAAGWDAVIVLSHCGFETDVRIAEACPRVSLVVGGHDHKVIEKPVPSGRAVVVQAGDRGRYLGEVTLTVAGPGAVSAEGRLLPVDASSPEDAEVAAYVKPFLVKEEEELGTVLGNLREALSGDRQLLRSAETPLGDLIADAMRQATGADCAFVNGGAIRGGLPAGDVRQRDIYGCLPYFDSVHTTVLTGAQIQALLDRCAAMPTTDPPGGFLQLSGVQAVYTAGKAAEVRVAGAALDPARRYTVACTNFLASGGDGLEEFTEGSDLRDWGVGLQDLLRRDLARPDLVIPTAGSRIRRP